MTEQEKTDAQWAMKKYTDIKNRLEVLVRQREGLADDPVEIPEDEILLYIPTEQRERFTAGLQLYTKLEKEN